MEAFIKKVLIINKAQLIDQWGFELSFGAISKSRRFSWDEAEFQGVAAGMLGVAANSGSCKGRMISAIFFTFTMVS